MIPARCKLAQRLLRLMLTLRKAVPCEEIDTDWLEPESDRFIAPLTPPLMRIETLLSLALPEALPSAL